MIATASSTTHRRHHRAIAAHFAGRTSTATEADMRAHLSLCSSCRHRYERHLLLARLDPRALPAADRLARGLGLRWRGSGGGRWHARLFAGLSVAAAAVTFLAIAPTGKPRSSVTSQGALANAALVARGADGSVGRAASFWTYHVGPEGLPRVADPSIARGDELAFAYSNPAAKPFLMIFGVDEHRHVYWFHPAWTAGQAAPTAVRAAPGPGPHELPDAIHQAFDGRRLAVYAAFSDHALDAGAVEAVVGRLVTPDAEPTLGEGVVMIARRYEVRP